MLEDMLDFSLFDKIERFRDAKLKDLGDLKSLELEEIKMSEVFDYFEQRPDLKNMEDVKDLTCLLYTSRCV